MAGNGVVYFLGNARIGEFESLHRRGHLVGLIRDTRSHSLCAPDDAFDVVLPWDSHEGVTGLAARLRRLDAEQPTAAVVNLREAYVEQCAQLLAQLGCPGMSELEVAELRSKARMRSVFGATIGPSSTGRHAPAAKAADVHSFGRDHGWPVILKPEALYSSLFVTRIAQPEQVVSAFDAMRRGIADHVASKGLPARFLRMQVEEYLQGSNHSVDLVVGPDGTPHPSPVVDVTTSADLGGAGFSHFARVCPSGLDPAAARLMQERACDAARALGLRRCAAHVEFIMTSDGPRLLEAAVRPGGHRIRMLDMAHGIDLPDAYLAVLQGRTPDLFERHHRPFAIVTPFPHSDGVFTGVQGLDRVRTLPSYRSHSVYSEPGTPIGLSTSGFWQVMAIELQHPSVEVVRADVASIWEMSDLVGVRPARDGKVAS